MATLSQQYAQNAAIEAKANNYDELVKQQNNKNIFEQGRQSVFAEMQAERERAAGLKKIQTMQSLAQIPDERFGAALNYALQNGAITREDADAIIREKGRGEEANVTQQPNTAAPQNVGAEPSSPAPIGLAGSIAMSGNRRV